MKLFFCLLVIIGYSNQLYCQKNVYKGPVAESVKSSHWDLYKYVWSHTNHDPTAAGKPVIDFNAIDNWLSLGEQVTISRDGQYFAYTIIRGTIYYKKFDTLVVQSTTGPWRQVLTGAEPGFFSGDNKQYIFKDHNDLCFLQIGSDKRRYVKDVANYVLPIRGHNDWFAYQLKDGISTVILQNLLNGKEKPFTGISSYRFDPSIRWFACHARNESNELIIYDLSGEKEQRFKSVASYSFDASGNALLIKTVEKTESASTSTVLYYINLLNGSKKAIWSSLVSGYILNGYSFDKTGNQVVFTTSDLIGNSIWYWGEGMDKAVMKVNNQTTGIDVGLLVGNTASFTGNDRYIQFLLKEMPNGRQVDSDAASVDVWSYQDTVLQSAQQSVVSNPKVYSAILNPANGIVIRLNRDHESVDTWIPGDYTIVSKQSGGDRFCEKGYGHDSTWLLSLENGTRRLLPVPGLGYSIFSPDGKWLVYFDAKQGCNYFSLNLGSGKIINISARAPAFQFGYRNFYLRTPEKPAYFVGTTPFAAWIGNDELVVYDNYDIWKLDITGENKPVNLTNGYGSANHLIFQLSGNGGPYRLLGKDTLLLKAFSRQTKYNGYYRKIPGSIGNPEKLYMGPCFIERLNYINVLSSAPSPIKAADANVWIVRKETATESPNYFVTRDFKKYNQLTMLAPEKGFNWYTTELHNFKQLDGSYSQGVLYKPENFNPKKKYPVIISFYTNLSDNLYQYAPAVYMQTPDQFDHPAWMVSHGYLVFVPDIYFIKGKWGPSVVNTVDGAARYLKNLSYVDGQHLGAVGHSNSGRFGYYLLTHSKSFAAMSIGSGFTGTNVIALGLSLDHTTGTKSNLEIAENTAVGTSLGNLWTNKNTWIDHTAVLQADRAGSPLLLFHNKKDGDDVTGAVQLYTAFRRLEKPVWWLQYDFGDHILGDLKEMRDFTIRYTQYFDHYLKGAPAPKWMTKGIPATLKTIEQRFELDPSGTCAIKNDCPICSAWNKQYKRTPEMFSKPIAEWNLDKDIKAALDKAEAARYKSNMAGEAQRIKENNEKLKGTWKGEKY